MALNWTTRWFDVLLCYLEILKFLIRWIKLWVFDRLQKDQYSCIWSWHSTTVYYRWTSTRYAPGHLNRLYHWISDLSSIWPANRNNHGSPVAPQNICEVEKERMSGVIIHLFLRPPNLCVVTAGMAIPVLYYLRWRLHSQNIMVIVLLHQTIKVLHLVYAVKSGNSGFREKRTS